ncbi:MAG: xanthine dehydrogenase family protein molybdopterin-binding subunit [Deltaproteobacteria bacterium]|nr:xanthine dehydrogenase family protein molybdopterin-binding subunit [Deltaproteobacteria bacterium]MBW2025404.1 xanthine dehydrogenase family protein molybdopterin-binding subunit [Deltaproteobacteria bacterium]MBW2125343.1 xanthine dehydrogenase family protein molybdopterin-binding subunit [Deltaproteobacteria bacterium]
MNQLRFVGSNLPRPDAPDKAAGRALYIHDLKRPSMLYGKIKYSEYAHAKIKHIDTSKADKLPGVRAVITGYNTPEIRIGFIRDNFALKRGKVRQFRDEVAAVAATDPEIAEEAIDLIKVEYEELPGVFTPEDALKEDAPLIHEEDPRGRPRKDNIVPVPWKFVSGDVEEAKKKAAYIAQGHFETPLIQQSCMGTAGCIAEFDLQNNLTIYTKTQIPFLAQNDFNRALAAMGLKGKNTRVIVPTLGGSFGTGLDTHAYEYIAILLAYKTGRPVKIVLTREEEFTALSPRQPTKTDIIQGCDKDGKLLFREIRMLLDNGAYTSWGATTPSVMMLPISSMYRVPNVYYETTIVYTNNTFCQAMRGYGNPQATWAIESNLDDLAEEAGIDPFEFRMINRNVPNDITPMGLHISTCGHKECLEAAAEKLSWKEKRGKGRKVARGVGMASLFHVGGSGRVYRSDGTGVIMKLDDFGNVSVITGGVEMGQGLNTALTLASAEALGVTPDKVTVVWGDTATCPWDVGTHASRGAFTACNAAIMAAEKARKKVFELAAEHFMPRVKKQLEKRKKKDPDFEIPDLDYERVRDPSEFDMKENIIFLKEEPGNPFLKVALEEILRAAHFKQEGTMIVTEAFYDPCNEMIDPRTCKGNLSATYIFGTQGVEVEVDLETGRVKVLHVVAAHDVGRVLSQQAIKGQIYGGVIQGLGYALCEEYKTDKGRNLNPNFLDYKIFSAPDVDFPIDIECIETIDQEGPFGAKGVGEPGLVPTAPAVANAIFDAIGVRIRSLPITPEKILAALKEKAKG